MRRNGGGTKQFRRKRVTKLVLARAFGWADEITAEQHEQDGELGLIHPPVGMNGFVIKSVVQDVTFSSIFKGVLPFIATDILRLVILIAFPIIALWLPGLL